MNVMSAWTTKKPGYTQHREEAELPRYDRQFFREEEKENELEKVIASRMEWHESVREDTEDC